MTEVRQYPLAALLHLGAILCFIAVCLIGYWVSHQRHARFLAFIDHLNEAGASIYLQKGTHKQDVRDALPSEIYGIDLNARPIRASELSGLRSLVRLNSLHLHNSLVTDVIASELPPTGSLRILSLGGTPTTEELFYNSRNSLRNLQFLQVGERPFSSRYALGVATLPIMYLSVLGGTIEPGACEQLVRCPSLESIIFKNCRIRDASLSELPLKCDTLRLITLINVSIDDSDAMRLRRHCEKVKCKFVFESYLGK